MSEWRLPESLPDLSNEPMIAVDVETYDPNLKLMGPGGARGDGELIGVAIYTPGWSWYLPIAHRGSQNLPKKLVAKYLNRELSRTGQPKVGANIKYDLEWLKTIGVNVDGPVYDIQYAEPLLDEHQREYSLDRLGVKHVGEHKKNDELKQAAIANGMSPKADVKQHMHLVPAGIVAEYAEWDAELTYRVFEKQKPLLEAERLWSLFELECSLIPMLVEMRMSGVKVSIADAMALKDRLTRELEEMQRDLDWACGFHVNVNSAQNLAKMFDQDGVRYGRTAPTPRFPIGNPSFTAQFMESLDYDKAGRVIQIKKRDRLKGTFVEKAILGHSVGGRIYTQFHPLRNDEYGTITGRFSSTGPNLQQVPSKDEELAPLIRGLFQPEDGEDWLCLDWSQIEYRIIVHYAYKCRLRRAADAVEAWRQDPTIDYHQMVADMTGLPRKYAKNLNFGLAYGMGVRALAGILGVSIDEARQISNTYHSRVPYVRALAEETSRETSAKGYVRTILGRHQRSPFWEPVHRGEGEEIVPMHHERALKVWGPNIKRAGLHKTLNKLIQGTAADLMKKAMSDVWKSGVCRVLGAPKLTVHDELDFSKPRTKEGDEAAREVKHIMETAIPLEVPVLVDAEIGNNWGHVEKWEYAA